MSHRLAALLTCLVVSIPSGRAQDILVEQDPDGDTASILVPAPQGIVEWRRVAQGIARAENLDEEAVASLLPSGTLNLDSAAAQWIIVAANIALGSGVRLSVQTERGRARALRVALDRGAMRNTLNVLKGIARQIVFRWDDRGDSRYGLFLDEDWQRFGGEHPLVIVIHGYSSKPEEFVTLRRRLRDAGFACAVFSYPNDASVALSGYQLASALQEFEQQFPSYRVSLLAHSMGGLVARVVIEDPEAAEVDNIDRLVMVATPNQGSNLARIPISLDAWEHWFDGEPDQMKTVFFDSVIDGLNEARVDLQPGSDFLDRLNGFPRNVDVRYSLLLGDKGPATREQLDELRFWLGRAQQENTVLRALGPRMDELLEDMDELVDDRGDGAVAVERGRLEGVDDTVVLNVNHGAITTDFSAAGSGRLLSEIIHRLDRED
jgi:pimeloyl-ACP methyl ester carboxylesterase